MSSRATRQLAQLWQLPLLLLSCVLFAFSGYLFVNASPGLTIRRRIDLARVYLANERPEAALQHLNRLLVGERLAQPEEASVHLLIGQALESAQHQLRIDIPANHTRIIEQTQLALRLGAKPTGEICRRLGDSYEALGQNDKAIAQFREAMALDPARALRLRKKIIEVESIQNDQAAVMASLDDYLTCNDLADAEKAWALGEKSQILADRGDFVAARSLIAEAMKLDSDPMVQAQANYRLAYCAWKLHRLDEAQKLAQTARQQFHGQHPLDADAAFLLARIQYEKNGFKQARALFEVVVTQYPRNRNVLESRLGTAMCDVYGGNEEAGLTELTALTSRVVAANDASIRDSLIKSLRQTSALLNGKLKYDQELAALELEKSLTPSPGAELLSAIASTAQKCAEQYETSAAQASGAEQVQDQQRARELFTRAAKARMELGQVKHSADAFAAGMRLYQRLGDPADAAGAMELFVNQHPNDAIVPDLLLQLGDCYSAQGMHEKAISAYRELEAKHADSTAARQGALALARAYVSADVPDFSSAEGLLRDFLDASAKTNIRDRLTDEAALELGDVYYRSDQYNQAISILEPLLESKPASDVISRATFLAADSYRKSAMELQAKVASANNAGSASELTAALAQRKAMLIKALGYYDRLIDLYKHAPASKAADERYEQQSFFHRGDCAYELGNFADAVRLYQSAAARYQNKPAALAAYVQIVNSYRAMGKTDEAKAANETAKAFLRSLPAEAFSNGSVMIPKAYWEQWLKWTSSAGSF